MRFIRNHSLFLVLLAFSALLRFIPLFDYQFTLDELSGLNRTRFDSFDELLEKGVKIDAHPALIQLLIFYLVKWFGYVTWIIKLPFLLFSLGAIAYAYCFGLRNFSKTVGLFSAALFSFSLVFVFYAPIARMYISGVFFSIALLYHFYEIFFQKNTRVLHFVFLGLFSWLSALNQHINALFALSVCLAGVFFLNKSNYKAYLITCVVTVIAYLPHLPITIYQFGLGGIGFEQGGWLEPPDWYAGLLFLQMVFGTGWTFLLILLLVVIRFLWDAAKPIVSGQFFLVLLFLINYWVVYQYSIHFAAVYQHSVMLFSGVAMVLFVCSFLDFSKPILVYPALSLFVFVLCYVTYIKKDFYRQTLNTVFEYQFKKTFEYQKAYGADNIYPVFFDADEFMRDLYFEKYKGQFVFQMSADSAAQSLNAFNGLLRSLKQELLILSSATPVHDALAKQYFPYLIENTVTQANSYRVYSKRAADKDKIVLGEAVLFEAGIHSGLEFRFHYKNEEDTKQFLQVVDSTVEFPLDARRNYASLPLNVGNYVLLKAKGTAMVMREKEAELCLSVTDELKNETHQYSAASLKSAYFENDSDFVLTAGSFIGTKHRKLKEMPANFNFYVWNRSREVFSIKDFKVTVIDHWPEKWGFWK